MKRRLIDVATEIVKILWIYVAVMVIIVTICIGAAEPVLGVGALVIATFINSAANIRVHTGGGADDSGRNET